MTRHDIANLETPACGPRPLTAPGQAWQVLAVTVMISLFAGLWLASLSSYPNFWDFDEGVYFNSARLVARGEPLYEAVFSSQPPLFITGLATAFRLGGDSPEVGRLYMALCGLLGLVVIARLGWSLAGPTGSLLAVVGAGSSFLYCRQGHFGEAEMPALALTLLAMGAALAATRTRPGLWSAVAGAFFAASVLCKILLVPIGLPLVLLLGLCRESGAAADNSSTLRLRPIRSWILSVSVFMLAALISAGLVLAFFSWCTFFRQAVAYHLDNKSLIGLEGILRNGAAMGSYVGRDFGLVCLAATGIAAYCRNRPITACFLAAWLGCGMIFLLVHQPMHAHHIVLLIPPLALMAGGNGFWLSGRCRACPSRVIAVCVLATLCVEARDDDSGIGRTLGGLRISVGPLRNWNKFLSTGTPREDREAIQRIQENISPADPVVADNLSLVFWAGRATPPALCDTSAVRIQGGWLTADECIRQSASARMVILWTGRLSHLPAYVQWVRQNYRLLKRFGDGREIYLKEDGR